MTIFDCGYSTDVDGFGTRLVFYLKGCNFRCDWCGAPEGISPRPEVLHYPGRTVLAGTSVTPQWVVSKALRCRAFADGVTFGGGEPTLQAEELIPVLRELKKNGIHTALESNASTERYREVIPWADQLFSDLKTLSPEKFAARISSEGSLPEKVRENLRHAAMTHPCLTIRIPVITGLNDDEAEEREIGVFLKSLLDAGGRFQVQLLRQHHIAEPKYAALNRTYVCRGVPAPDVRVTERFAEILNGFQIGLISDQTTGGASGENIGN